MDRLICKLFGHLTGPGVLSRRCFRCDRVVIPARRYSTVRAADAVVRPKGGA